MSRRKLWLCVAAILAGAFVLAFEGEIAMLVANQRPDAEARRLIEMLGGTASAIMVIFRAVCRLHGEVPPPDNARLVEQVARLAQLDAAPFDKAVRVARGETAVTTAEAMATAAGYVGGMERLVRHLDAYKS